MDKDRDTRHRDRKLGRPVPRIPLLFFFISKLSGLHLFLGPATCFVFLFYFVPVALTALMSLTAMGRTLDWEFIGTENYVRLFSGADPLVLGIVRNTIVYVAGALPTTIGVGLLISLLSMRMRRTAGLLFRAIFFIPRAIPPVVWGYLWAWSFEGTRYGVFNSILVGLGFSPIHWLTRYPMLIVVLANGFLGVSLAMLVFTSAIAAVPVDYTRAAEVDGASFWQVCRYVIIPLLKWPIATMTIWHLMSFINSYVYVMLITGGGPYYATEVWSLYGYHAAFRDFQYGYGSSLVMILVAANAVLFFIAWKALGIRRLLAPTRVEV